MSWHCHKTATCTKTRLCYISKMAKKTAEKAGKLTLKQEYIGARVFTAKLGREVEIVNVQEQFPLYYAMGLTFIFENAENN